MPLIGPIDPGRADPLTVRLLAELSRTGARHAILDLTGVQPATAQALVELGADLSAIATQRNMQQALQQLVARR